MEPMIELEVTEHVFGVVMTEQYSLNAGLKGLGKNGEDAVTK